MPDIKLTYDDPLAPPKVRAPKPEPGPDDPPRAKIGRPTNEMLAARKAAELELDRQFPERMTQKMQKLWDQLADSLAKKTDKISPAAGFIALGILTDKLRDRSVPTTVHNTQMVFNGYSREDAMALLKGKEVKKAEAVETESHHAYCTNKGVEDVKARDSGAFIATQSQDQTSPRAEYASPVSDLETKELR